MSTQNVFPTSIGPGAERAAIALSYGATQAEAARVGDISERTIRRWLTNEQFQRLVSSYRAQNVYELERQLSELQSVAVTTLAELTDPSNPGSVRLAASKAILDIGQRVREEFDAIRRIQALEAVALDAMEAQR